MANTRKFIIQPTEEELKKFSKAARELIVKGRQQRFVTNQEIEAALPPIEDDVELHEDFIDILQKLGVEIIDHKKAIDWRKKKRIGQHSQFGQSKKRKKGAKETRRSFRNRQ